MDEIDFYDHAAKVETARLNEVLKKRGIEPNPEFTAAWEKYLAKDKRLKANRRRKRIDAVNQRDARRPLIEQPDGKGRDR